MFLLNSGILPCGWKLYHPRFILWKIFNRARKQRGYILLVSHTNTSNMHIHTLEKTLGATLLLTGLALRYWIGYRRFNRRNFAGIEVFTSFSKKTIILFFERIARSLAGLLILSGILFIVSCWL